MSYDAPRHAEMKTNTSFFQGIADREMVVHKPVANVATLDFDKSKKGVKKAKNKIAPDSMSQVSGWN